MGSCPRCFASHNVLLCPQEGEDNLLAAQEEGKSRAKEGELMDAYAANQLGENINLLREYTEERRVLPARDVGEDTDSEDEEIINNYVANQLTERVTLVRENSEVSRNPGVKLSSSSKESLSPPPPLEVRPYRERLFVLPLLVRRHQSRMVSPP